MPALNKASAAVDTAGLDKAFLKAKKISFLKLWIIQLMKFIGPAFVVSVAYIDPGNFATNISSGSFFNYNLLWVILCSNIMAIFLQINSAKLGIATGKKPFTNVWCGF